MAGFPMQAARKYVKLYRRIAKMKAELKKLEDRYGKDEEGLLKAFAKTGLQNLSVDGAVIFLRRQIWASAEQGQSPALAAAMRELGMGDMVKPTVNSSRMSAYVRELPRDDNNMPILPKPLAPLVKVRDVFSVRVNEKPKPK